MLQDNELLKIQGGAAKLSIGIIVGALITLLVGIIDGYLRPLKCNK